jgi:CRISPR-associated protein Csa1
MFYVDPFELDRMLRYIKDLHKDEVISDEYRGWNWSQGRLTPISTGLYLSVSEIANRYCSNYRDIYLRRVARVYPPKTYKSVRGLFLHQLSSETLMSFKSYLYSKGIVSGYKLVKDMLDKGPTIIDELSKKISIRKYLTSRETKALKMEGLSLYRYLVIQAASALDKAVSSSRMLALDAIVHKVIPDVVEMGINGQELGLSKELRIDVYLGKLIAELKTGSKRDFHKYILAGYALAIEADKEFPVDYGVVIYISIKNGMVKVDKDMFFIGDELREEFLQMRDEAFEIVESGRDPGIHINCPEYCIYYHTCRGG